MTFLPTVRSREYTPKPIKWFWDSVAVLLVASIGLLSLIFPFAADHAVAMTGAKILDAGGILYVDFWDNKMPGLIWFYLLAGKLFGFTEIGVHLLELIWMSIFSVVLIGALPNYLGGIWFARLAPLAVVGIYYAGVELFALTQLEILVSLPIFLSLWLTNLGVSRTSKSRALFFFAGIAAGITVVFKIVFAPLFVVFWLIATAYLVIREGAKLREIILNVWIPVSAGVVCILGAVVAKFWADGALDELLWTAFVYPPEALSVSPPALYNQLFESVLFFGSYYAAWSGFIVFAIIRWWRGSRDIITSLLIAWLLTGVVLILIQRFSWWPYHFLMLFTPAGILGVRGLSELFHLICDSLEPRRIGPAMLGILLTIPLLGAAAIPIGQKAILHVKTFVRKDSTIAEFQTMLAYGYIEQNTRFLAQKTALPGKIYVFGDPVNYVVTGRMPAAPIIGWPWDYFLQSQWVLLPKQLAISNPPYIYVDRLNKIAIERRGGGVKEYIEQKYLAVLRDEKGTWFILKPAFRTAKSHSGKDL